MTIKIDNISAKQELLNNKFHQYYFITLDEDFTSGDVYNLSNNQTVNVVIPFEKILNVESGYGLAHLLNCFNDTYSNVLITNSDNFNVIHKCEVYKDTFFIKLQPYTTKIALHIIPKVYDATDNILFFKDEFMNNEDYSYNLITGQYYTVYNDEEHKNINLYYQSQLTNEEVPIPTITLAVPEVVEINKPFEINGVLNVKEINTIHWAIPKESLQGEVQTDKDGKFVIEIDGLHSEETYTINCNFYANWRYNACSKSTTFYVNDIAIEQDIADIDMSTITYVESPITDRPEIAKPYPQFSKFDSQQKCYYKYTKNNDDTYQWVQENYDPYKTYAEFNFDISKRNVSNPHNTQINVGYRYNGSSPQNAVHYVGVKDKSNYSSADRCTLIDANFDGITQNSNVIEQFELNPVDDVVFPTTASPLNTGFTHESGLHSSNIGKLYHKTIKYFNDEMYVEEFDGEKIKHMHQEWYDLDND